MKTIRTTCSYCSVGCNFDGIVDEGKLVSFKPNQDYPVNLGKSCPKGFHLLKPFSSPHRATIPLLRDSKGIMKEISWDNAINEMVNKFKTIKENHGPESVAFLSTGQMPLEEMAFLGALFKFGMGFIHADGNTRQCMATAAVAYKQSFGFDAPPYSYKDFELSDLIIFIGSNPVITHPIMWNRVKMNANNAKIIVIDPRRSKTAEQADLHIPVKPKGDLDLLYAIANTLLENDWVDHDFIKRHVSGFDEFAVHIKNFSAEAVESRSNVSPAVVYQVAKSIHEAKNCSLWWTMGVNQSHQGVRTAQAIINIALMTGNMGRPGTGANSITGQANAMGSRLFSNTTSMFAGYDFLKEEDRLKMADLLHIDPETIPTENSMPYHKILEECGTGKIKGLWIIATNPVHSWIDRNELIKKFEKLDFIVVQELFTNTETAEYADLLLPAAGSGEKTGIMINSERRLGIVDKLMDPPGDARTDFDIFKSIAKGWGCSEMFSQWTDPESVFRILRDTTEGRPCDFTGISGYDMIRSSRGIQWPYPKNNPPVDRERRLFSDGKFYTADGKAKMIFDNPQPVPEALDSEFPTELLTGRGSVVQFHTQTRTGKVDMLNKLSPKECYVEINPLDASKWDLQDGDDAEVSSRRGSVIVKVVLTDSIKTGQAFMPMHYEETNSLTYPAFDPYSAQPAYKHAAIRIKQHQLSRE